VLTKNNTTFAAITITAMFLAGFVAIGQVDKVFSQTISGNMTATSSNASSMEAN